jgi:hypothetical protein
MNGTYVYVTSTLVSTKFVASGSDDGTELDEQVPVSVFIVAPYLVQALTTRLAEFGSDEMSEATKAAICAPDGDPGAPTDGEPRIA